MSEYNFVIGIHVERDKLIISNKILGYRLITVHSMKVTDLYTEDLIRALQKGVQLCNARLGKSGKVELIDSCSLHYPYMYRGRYIGTYLSVSYYNKNYHNSYINRNGFNTSSTTKNCPNEFTVIAKMGDYAYIVGVDGKTRIINIAGIEEDIKNNSIYNDCRFGIKYKKTICTNYGIDGKTCGKILTYSEAGLSESRYNSDGSDKKLDYAVNMSKALDSKIQVDESGTLSNMKTSTSKHIDIKYPVSIIGAAAFKDNINVEEVVIGKGVVEIGEDAFCGCTSIKNITIGDDVIKIGMRAFSGINLDILRFPNNSTLRLGSHLFSNGYGYRGSVAKIIIPDKVRLDCLNDYTLQGISVRKGLLGIKAEAKCAHEVKDGVFTNCENLRVIAFDGGWIYKVGSYSFYNCMRLKQLDLRKVRNIGYGAFAKCGITNIELNEIECIDDCAFYDCSNLRKVIIRSDKLQPIISTPFGGATFQMEIVCTTKSAYKVMKTWVDSRPASFKYCGIKVIYDEQA